MLKRRPVRHDLEQLGDRTGESCAPGRPALRKCNLVAQAQSLPKEQFKAEVERELTGRESEPSELIYFKVYTRARRR